MVKQPVLTHETVGSAVSDAPDGAADQNSSRRRVFTSRPVLYLASVVIGLGIWQAAAVLGSTGLLPPPSEVASVGWEMLVGGELITNAAASLKRVLLGFVFGVALAVPSGFLMGWYRWASGMLEPWVQFLRTIPPLALIPLVIVFLGIGEAAKVFLIFFAAYLATVIGVIQGVRSVDKTLIDAARVLGAGDASVFVRVVIPATFPYLLVGMRIALGNAWATLVAAELIAANSGLGHMMKVAATYFRVPTVIVGILTIGALGFAMDRTVLRIDRRLTRWQDKRAV